MNISLNITTINRTEIEKCSEGNVNYLEDCIDSLLEKTQETNEEGVPTPFSGENIESNFIFNIFDDGSKDDSFIDKSLNKHPEVNFRKFKNSENIGIFKTINKVLQQGLDDNADWIFLIQDDAIFMRNTLKSFEETLSSVPEDAGILSYLAMYPCPGNKKWNKFSQEKFYCFCCVALRKEAVDFWLKSDLVNEERNRGGDIIIPRYIHNSFDKYPKIYKWGTNLAMHNGRWSTVQGKNKWADLDKPTSIGKRENFRKRNSLVYVRQ